MENASVAFSVRPSRHNFPEAVSHSTPPKLALVLSMPRPVMISLSPEQRHAKVAEAAYFMAEQRGFAPGHAYDDWRTAEILVDAQIWALD